MKNVIHIFGVSGLFLDASDDVLREHKQNNLSVDEVGIKVKEWCDMCIAKYGLQ